MRGIVPAGANNRAGAWLCLRIVREPTEGGPKAQAWTASPAQRKAQGLVVCDTAGTWLL